MNLKYGWRGINYETGSELFQLTFDVDEIDAKHVDAMARRWDVSMTQIDYANKTIALCWKTFDARDGFIDMCRKMFDIHID